MINHQRSEISGTLLIKSLPSQEQIAGFMEPGHDGPIYMLNLLKFKEKAEYSDGRDTDLTGAEAYAIYSEEVVEHLANVGGGLMFAAARLSA